MKRRDFIKLSAMGGMALAMRPTLAWARSPAAGGLRSFIQPLPQLGAAGIPLATNRTPNDPAGDFYEIEAGQYQHQFHPDLDPSTLWGYADVGGTHGYLGGVIVARKDRPVRLRVYNRLPSRHPLPVDTTLMGADGAPNRISVHLHGGFVPWNSDGGPFAWYDPSGSTGPSFANPVVARGSGPIPGVAEYYYPNQQSARLMWYHDHALGITRLNAYAGLATAYLITDDVEQSLIAQGLVRDVGIPLVLQDKSFVDGTDPNYVWGQRGDLWYPYRYDPADQDPANPAPLPVPSCVPEFFGDHPVVNGAVSPYLEVEQRHYRLRILNAAQASFYNLQLHYADASGQAADTSKPGPVLLQIGTEGGFLPAPVPIQSTPIGFDAAGDASKPYSLLLAPAERADVIVDFSNVPAGSKLILYTDAPRPFPSGDPPGGVGGLLQLRVVRRKGAADPASFDDLAAGRATLPPVPPVDARHAKVRNLTLNEDYDEYGRLIQRLGTAKQNGLNTDGQPTWGRNYTDSATETPKAGTVEIWNIFNLTGDTHPIHFHLVNVQVLQRQAFDVPAWMAGGGAVFTGAPTPPDANERGWKETVRMNPGECTSVIMRFDLPSVPFAVPTSPRTGGYEYVWHCHILEHEEHDMMRPLIVG